MSEKTVSMAFFTDRYTQNFSLLDSQLFPAHEQSSHLRLAMVNQSLAQV